MSFEQLCNINVILQHGRQKVDGDFLLTINDFDVSVDETLITIQLQANAHFFYVLHPHCRGVEVEVDKKSPSAFCQLRPSTSVWNKQTVITQSLLQCSRMRILRFFSYLKKKHDFLRFFEMKFQKNVKVTKKYQVCWMSIEILASNSRMLWVLIGIYHTQFSFA